MGREKRLKRVVAYIPMSMAEQLELFRDEGSNVISMSDYLHDVIEEHIRVRSAMSIRRQTISRRLGNS